MNVLDLLVDRNASVDRFPGLPSSQCILSKQFRGVTFLPACSSAGKCSGLLPGGLGLCRSTVREKTDPGSRDAFLHRCGYWTSAPGK